MIIAVLVSGGGTNLQALIDYEKANQNCPYKIACVLSDHKDAYALERAKNADIPTAIVSPYAVMGAEIAKAASREEKRIRVSDKVLEICKENKVDVIVQAGWLTVLSGAIISEYKDHIINLHPALLPKFGGVGMWGHHVHEAVLAAGEKESGCTVHIADGGCDTGRILVQKAVPVEPGDTVDTLYSRIAPKEKEALIEGVLMLASEY
ncbi:phosphoribosylglycinamide formyltransferase [Treponema sp.]|uniref:phosphoribosylglycinamide formyltransferase n=1 Tax=Treponema sp. TaxID=166 RepID=UPI00298D9A5D|nr:phosphoribosylglycinamide formyltransferase [Treponema sp.]